MRVLITGSNGYIGRKLKEWLRQWPDSYEIETIDLREESWRDRDFSLCNVIIHLAAVVHKKESPEMKELYKRVNVELTLELANKAKQAGVPHFIFMSSISVYGIEGSIKQNTIINEETQYNPKSLYGESKLNAEFGLIKLREQGFSISIIRAPMIYGPDCPGNFSKLKSLLLKTPIFPLVKNSRSMLYIDNLSEFIRLIVVFKSEGLFFPQNKEYVNTMDLVRLIAKNNSKKIFISTFLGFLIKHFSGNFNFVTLNKVFGNLEIDLELSSYMDFAYNVVEFEQSLILCES
ncbi:NAD-dependent epimerase/dehydratase family protein [Paenibacillus sp. 22594]|uniref:NAD-dependent epimerase/dehydratase family protein n=1 Tax=Paenibacillus sp. 22594 TaxID=3453947 RepID=UPI003F86C17B